MKQRIKRILSITITLSLVWRLVSGIAPVKSYTKGQSKTLTIPGNVAVPLTTFCKPSGYCGFENLRYQLIIGGYIPIATLVPATIPDRS